jgi:S1-C subfamily serine protease
MFRNPAANDYTVTNPAVLQQSGFVNFPMDQFGKPGCLTPPPIHNSGSTTPISDPEPFMGATITSVDTAGQSVAGLPDLNGVLFLAVPLNSYAYKQGFRINDVTRSVNGTNITTKASFWAIYNTLAPGSAVHTIIYRNQTSQEFNFKKISGAETSN